jgi:hypothetical protein
VFETTSIAMKTAKREKLDYLRNGLVNLASGMELDDFLRNSIFSYIDRFSLLHIEVLRIMASPSQYKRANEYASAINLGGTQFEMIKRALGMEISNDVLEFITVELQVAMFANVAHLHTMTSPSSLLEKLTRPAGDAFLRFISTPFTDDDWQPLRECFVPCIFQNGRSLTKEKVMQLVNFTLAMPMNTSITLNPSMIVAITPHLANTHIHVAVPTQDGTPYKYIVTQPVQQVAAQVQAALNQ